MNKNKYIKALEKENAQLKEALSKELNDKTYIANAIKDGIKQSNLCEKFVTIEDTALSIHSYSDQKREEQDRLAEAYDLSEKIKSFKERKYKEVLCSVDHTSINPFKLSSDEIKTLRNEIVNTELKQNIFNEGFNFAIKSGKTTIRK